MALARSASGPGGLSINTGSANSLFGSSNTNQAPASGGLFGASMSRPSGSLFTATSTTGPQSAGVFGSTQPSSSLFTQPQPPGGLFRSSTATTQPQQTGGLFGSSTTTSQPNQGGLFGSLNNTAQPQQTGGLFGNSNANSQPQQASRLFGSLGAQSAQNQGTSTNAGGLFSSGATSQQPIQPGGLFGNMNSQNQNSGQSLFGSNMNQNQQPNSLFPSTNRPFVQPNNSVFGSTMGGGLTMGQSQNATPHNAVPGVRIDLSQIRTTTRFNDIHEELQKEIENLDTFILAQIQQCHDCHAIMPSHEEQLAFIPDNVDFLSRKLIGVESSLETDAQAIEMLGKLIRTDAEYAKLSFRAADNLKLPPQYHQKGIWNSAMQSSSPDGGAAQDIVSFFSKTTDEMSATLAKYQRSIGEIELHLRGVESSTAQRVSQMNGGDSGEQMRELAAVLREFEAGIMGVATSVGGAREGLQRLQLGGFVDDMQSNGRVNGNGKRMGVY